MIRRQRIGIFFPQQKVFKKKSEKGNERMHEAIK